MIPLNCPAQEIKDPNSKKNIKREEMESMIDLALALQANVEIKDRKSLMKTYSNCFVGKKIS